MKEVKKKEKRTRGRGRERKRGVERKKKGEVKEKVDNASDFSGTLLYVSKKDSKSEGGERERIVGFFTCLDNKINNSNNSIKRVFFFYYFCA